MPHVLPTGMARYPATVLDAFARFADRVAFVHNGRETTYGDALRQVYRFAHVLQACGLGRGDGVAFLTGNSPHAFLACVAAQLLGCRAIGIDPVYSTPEQEHITADAQAVALVLDPTMYGASTGELLRGIDPPVTLSLGPAAAGQDLLDLAEHHPDTPVPPSARHDDVARLLYTSGSTGRSKGCCHTFDALSAHWAWQPARWSPQVTLLANAAHRYLLTSPAAVSVAGDYMALALLRGGTVYVHDGFDAGVVLRTIEQERITAAFIGTAKLYRLLDDPALDRTDTTSLQALAFAGSAITTRHFRQALDRFGPVLYQGYGQNEAGLISVLAPDDLIGSSEERLLSAGRPQPGVDVTIRSTEGREVDTGGTGEIWIRTPQLMTGYWHRPDLTAQALHEGWLRTGDLGFQDADGYLYLVDRAKDMVIVRSRNCFSRIIEEVLARHPAVHQVAVVGIPDESDGEAVHAVVVTHSGATVQLADLRNLVRRQLSPLHAPRSVAFVEQLPLTSAGKVDKKALRAPFWNGQERQIH